MTDGSEDARPASLEGVRLVTLAQNVPGPAAAARLQSFGVSVVKVEPPNGLLANGRAAATSSPVRCSPLFRLTSKPHPKVRCL